jgi:ZIP family zinc transporter
MIHNIPEGIAIAIPCLAARPDSPFLSFVLASVSGLAEPAGAFISLVFLRGVERRQVERGGAEGVAIGGEGSLENVLAFVAGIMITVSFLELFPEAKRHTEKSGMTAYYAGLSVGFIVMIATEYGMSL